MIIDQVPPSEGTQTDFHDTEPLSSGTTGKPLLFGVPALIFLVAVSVLWWNAAPSLTFHDSGEFALAAASGGIPHPPGAPTWTILATVFVWLGGFSDPAYGTNLFCGLLGAVTLALTGALAGWWTLLLIPRLGGLAYTVAAVTAALVLLHSPAFLDQSLMTEQYTLMTALQAGMLLVATRLFVINMNSLAPIRQLPGTPAFCAALLGLLWGLAIGNHLSQISMGLFVACALAAYAWRERRLATLFKLSGWTVLGLVSGLLVFLWLPIRSRANPLMDWGNVETWDRFLWAIQRKQWTPRPLSDSPPHFVREWFYTYDLIGELGLFGFILALIGIVLLLKRRFYFLGLLAAVSVPYAAGMLLGHMKQKGMDVYYIRHYGVSDWHLPIYMSAAVAAGLAIPVLLSLVTKSHPAASRFRHLAAVACLLLLAIPTGMSVADNSLRNWKAPEQYVADVLAPLPDDALILLSTDNLTHMLAYKKHTGEPKPWWMAYFINDTPAVMLNAFVQGRWKETRSAFFRHTMSHPDFQPLRSPVLSQERAETGAIFTDTPKQHETWSVINHMKPTGYLFEICDKPLSDSEVREAEEKWRQAHPNLFQARPSPRTHRLEREARGLLHFRRAEVFFHRKMWNESAAEYRLSVEWLPTNGDAWFCLAYSAEQLKAPMNIVKGLHHEAIRVAPWNIGPRQNLAGLLVAEHSYQEAEQLLKETLALDPDNAELIANLAYVRQQIAAPPANSR